MTKSSLAKATGQDDSRLSLPDAGKKIGLDENLRAKAESPVINNGVKSEATAGSKPFPKVEVQPNEEVKVNGSKALPAAQNGGPSPNGSTRNGLVKRSAKENGAPAALNEGLGEKKEPILLTIEKLSFYFGENKVLKEIDLPIRANSITSLIGPSGCGKTTLLRCFNRMHDLYPNNHYEGRIVMDGRNILDKSEDLIWLRSRLGMVFQKPTPFPMSVYDNIAYGLKLKKITNKPLVRNLVEKALRQANLWDEVKDRLKESALGLSGGQQQRLSIARSLAVSPAVLLFDEATSALDPISSAKIEEMMVELKKEVTMVVVTHNMQQAARVSDYTALMWLGSLVEYGETADIFTRPKMKMTEQYVAGNFG